MNLPERVHAVDVKYPCMVVATADKKFYVFNLDSPQKPFRVRLAAAVARMLARQGSAHGERFSRAPLLRAHPRYSPRHLLLCARGRTLQEMTFKTPMKLQTRCIKLFSNKQMFAIGSIEGRVALRCVDEAMDNA